VTGRHAEVLDRPLSGVLVMELLEPDFDVIRSLVRGKEHRSAERVERVRIRDSCPVRSQLTPRRAKPGTSGSLDDGGPVDALAITGFSDSADPLDFAAREVRVVGHVVVGPDRRRSHAGADQRTRDRERLDSAAQLGVRIFQNESFFTTFPSRSVHRSQPRTSIRCPSVVVPDKVHSEAPRSPSTKC